jgi:hypothetical protein
VHVVPLQTLPPQHGSPLKPQLWHWAVPATVAHTVFASVHALPAQQGPPLLPQMAHVLVASQIRLKPLLAGQVPPGQHFSPSLPHVVQVLVASHMRGVVVLEPGHDRPGQQGSRSLPHDSQNPPVEQTSMMEPVGAQRAPGATHVCTAPELSQQPPALHWSRQHG